MAKPTLKDLATGLDAMWNAIDGDPEESLKQIGQLDDPHSMRRRLILLLRLNRVDEAAALVANRVPDEEWAEVAIKIFIRKEDASAAKAFIDQVKALTDTSGTLLRRCLVQYAHDIDIAHRQSLDATSPPRSYYAVEPKHQKLLDSFLEVSAGVMLGILARDEPLSIQLDKELVQLYLMASALRSRTDSVPELLTLLVQCRSVPIGLASMALEGRMPMVPVLGRALMESEGQDPYARCIAGALDARSGGSTSTALEVIQSNIPNIKAGINRQHTAMLGFDLSQDSGDEVVERFVIDVCNALPDDAEVSAILQTRLLLRNKKADDALKMAQSLPAGNAFAELMIADCYSNLDQKENELIHLKAQALQSCVPSLLSNAGALAFELEKYGDAIECLEKLVYYYPESRNARRNLVTMYFYKGSYDKAITEGESILASGPDDLQVRGQLGQLYLTQGKPDMAVRVTEPWEKQSDLLLEPVLIRIQALDTDRQWDRAFDFAERHREKFWDESQFVVLYMRVASHANNDYKSHQGLEQMTKLSAQGKVNKEQFRIGTLDDVKELIAGAQSRREEMSRQSLSGRMPWTSAALVENTPIYMAWYLRTQPMPWLVEEPLTHAQYSIYSTNGYGVARLPDAEPRVEPISFDDTAKAAVLDYSALVTLTELKLLSKLPSIYSAIIVPDSYRQTFSTDLQRLSPHQQSRLAGLQRIRRLVDDHKIGRTPDDANGQTIIDEYDSARPVELLRLQDVRDLIRTSGLLSVELSKRFDEVIHNARTDAPATQLVSGATVTIRLLTFETLIVIGALDVTLETLRVNLWESDYQSLVRDLREFDAQEIVRTKFDAMRAELAKLPIVQYEAVAPEGRLEIKQLAVAVDSYLIAKERQIPLVADDRVLQTSRINETGNIRAAFGTDKVLAALRSADAIDDRQYGDALVQLVVWRYRFVVIPASVMLSLAERYKTSIPGRELRQVAQYVHDCMRDPGLFGGLEPSSPPTSMAVKLYLDWSGTISQFIYQLWTADGFAEDEIAKWTRWVATHLYPSPPACIAPPVQARLSEIERKATITMTVMNAGGRNIDDNRVSSGLKILGEAMGLTEDEVDQAVVELVTYANRD